jgi:hypothetical protein
MRRLAASLEQHRQTATISGGKLRTLWISCDVKVLVDTVGASVQTRIVDFEISFRRNMERFRLETASNMLCWRFGEKTRRKAASPTKLKSDPLNKNRRVLCWAHNISGTLASRLFCLGRKRPPRHFFSQYVKERFRGLDIQITILSISSGANA